MGLLNKRIEFFIVFVALAALVSCKPSPKNAQRYYENVTDIIEPLLQKENNLIVLINKEMGKAASGASVLEKPSDNSNAVADKELDDTFIAFKVQVEQALSDARRLESFDGETGLKDALVKLLEEYQQIVSNEYPEILKIVKIPSSVYTNEDDNKFILLTEKVDDRLQEKIDNFTKESKTFAMKYKFEIATDNDTIPKK
ncbi:MAG: hypothetical protein WCM76_01455 [Bacteroidota bacterium]